MMKMKSKWKSLGIDLAYDIAGSILYAVGIYTFARNANFAPGGLSGLALILNHLFGLPIGITTLALNVPVIIASYRFVGKKFLAKSFKSMLISTFFLDVIFPYTPEYTGSPFIAALYAGAFSGAGLALFYMRGSSSGGTDFLTISIKKLRPHLSIGTVTAAIDIVIIGIGGIVFGNVDAVLYGLAMTFIMSLVLDKIMYGAGAGTLAIIITDHGKEVAESISELSGRGSTLVPAVGTYTEEEKDVILCACSRNQTYMIQNAVIEVDSKAFVMLTETSQVFGEGFLRQ